MDQAAQETTEEDIGNVVRALRKGRSLTLAELSQSSGLPISTLSRVETGKMHLSYDKLLRISGALNVDLAAMLSRSGAPLVRDDAPASDGRIPEHPRLAAYQLETRNYTHVYNAASLLSRHFFPVFVEPKSRTPEEFGPLSRHAEEEFAFVVSGEVMIHTDAYAPVVLGAGESIYIASGMGHAYLRVGDQPCRMLLVNAGGEDGPRPHGGHRSRTEKARQPK